MTTIDAAVINALEPYFDKAYYLACNPDVARAGVDALYHFHVAGWREGRNPSKQFDCKFYLKSYPDVAAADMNPLLHFAWSGKAEGRLPRRRLDDERRILESFETLPMRSRHWQAAADNTDPNTLHDLMKALLRSAPTGRVIALSHDDYLNSVGGVQNVMRDELHAFEAAAWEYIHITPSAPLPMLASEHQPHLLTVKVRIGRNYFGIVTTSTLAAALSELRARGEPVFMIIHHMMGYSPEAIALLMGESEGPAPIVWLHDYFTHCPSYALLRNDLTYCGGPPVNSASCRVCGYGGDRVAHLTRLVKFFDKYRPVVLSPSDTALRSWYAMSKLSHSGARVIPLASLEMRSAEQLAKREGREGALRVAFLGGRVHLKGWRSFERLAMSMENDQRYDFYQLGSNNGEPSAGAVKNIEVSVTATDPTAMIDALVRHCIDAVIIMPICKETFSFTVHEALAAGVFIITGRDTGNVWPAVVRHAPQAGAYYYDMDAIAEAFKTGLVLDAVRGASTRGGILQRGVGAAQVVFEQWMEQRQSKLNLGAGFR